MTGRRRGGQLVKLHDIYMPPELLTQIIARLPPKTLMQSRCVCKDWRSLIDSPYFISMHLNLYRNCHAKTQLLTLERARGASSKYTFVLRRTDTFRKIAQLFEYSDPYVSCESSLIHGLLLLSSSKSDAFTLLNPSIQKSLTLPRCPLNFSSLGCSRFLGHVEQNYTRPGPENFAPSNGDYKVVVLERFVAAAFEMAFKIYSLRDHCWREYMMKVPEWSFNLMQKGHGTVYSQGAVYWRPSQSRENAPDTGLLSFDFDSEEFRYLKLPDVEEGMLIFLFVFGGSLAVFGISSVRSCIWVLEKDAGNEPWRRCWDRDTSLDVYELFKDFSVTSYQIMYIEDTGTLLLRKSMKLVAYNIRSNQTQHLLKNISFSYVDTYVESLVLYKGTKDTKMQDNSTKLLIPNNDRRPQCAAK